MALSAGTDRDVAIAALPQPRGRVLMRTPWNFIPFLQATQNCVVSSTVGSPTRSVENEFEGRVLFIFLVFVERRGAYARSSPRASAGSTCSKRRSRLRQHLRLHVCNSSMNRMIWPCASHLFQHRLQAILKFTSIFAPASIEPRSNPTMALVAESSGHHLTHSLRPAFNDCGFSDAGLADEYRIFLVRRESTCACGEFRRHGRDRIQFAWRQDP